MNIQNDFKNDSLIQWLKYSDTDEVKKMYEEIQNKIDVLINKRDNLRVALTDKENKNLR